MVPDRVLTGILHIFIDSMNLASGIIEQYVAISTTVSLSCFMTVYVRVQVKKTVKNAAVLLFRIDLLRIRGIMLLNTTHPKLNPPIKHTTNFKRGNTPLNT
jgi:hypothetical protein